jgi:hypothetical protein
MTPRAGDTVAPLLLQPTCASLGRSPARLQLVVRRARPLSLGSEDLWILFLLLARACSGEALSTDLRPDGQ